MNYHAEKDRADMLEAQVKELRQELAELQATFDLRWEADMRALRRWHDAGNDPLVWPDHADLTVWLMEQNDRLHQQQQGDLQQLMDVMAEWSDTTFGPGSGNLCGQMAHLREETREVESAPDDIIEYADVLILLLDAARRRGFAGHRLLTAALAKIAVVKQRGYAPPDVNGIRRHVSSGGA